MGALVSEVVDRIYNRPEECRCVREKFYIPDYEVDSKPDEDHWYELRDYMIELNLRDKYNLRFEDTSRFPKVVLGFWDKRKLWTAYKWWIANAPLEYFIK